MRLNKHPFSKNFKANLSQYRELAWSHKLFLLIYISFFLFFYNIWTSHMFFTDEIIIEDSSYAMAHGSSLIVPMLEGFPHFVKPPLLYWQTALLYYLFPYSHLLVRLWMPIYGIATVFVTYRLANLWYNQKAGFLSGLFLATSWVFIYYTKGANFDIPNTFFTITTIYLYNLAKKKSNLKLLILTSLSLGLGILERSLLALTPIVVITIDQFISHKKIPLIRLLSCLLFSLLIVGLWNLLAYLSEPLIYVRDNITMPFQLHLAGNFPGDVKEPYFYLAVFDWFYPVFFLFCYRYFYALKSNSSAFVQLLVWIVGLGGVLFIARTQHTWYLLALFPALAIASGTIAMEILSKSRKDSFARFITVNCILLFIVVPPVGLLIRDIPQAETVTAVSYIKENNNGEPVYFWRYEILPHSKFYPGRGVIIVDDNNIKQILDQYHMQFILARTEDLGELSSLVKPIKSFPYSQYTVLQFY